MPTRKKSLISSTNTVKKAVAAKSSKVPAGKGIQSARAVQAKSAKFLKLASNHNQTLL